MAKLVFGMNVSLDGIVNHDKFAPGPELFRHFIREAEGQAGSIYGRRMYEIMRYWDDDQPEWGDDERAFAAAWRRQSKWVVSRRLEEVGPNATLLDADNLEAEIRAVKDSHDGEIEIAGPVLANSVPHGLIDEYRLYLHPVVIGEGDRYLTTVRPPLKLVGNDPIAGGVVRLTYVLA